MPDLIPPHGGYEKLQSWQMAVIVHDGTVDYCNQHISLRSRTHDQMVQAARSGKQNIAEGSMASGTSKKTELKLIGFARASLEELLNDYRDYLRQHALQQWEKDNPKAIKNPQPVLPAQPQLSDISAIHPGHAPGSCRKHTDLPDSPDQLSSGPAATPA